MDGIPVEVDCVLEHTALTVLTLMVVLQQLLLLLQSSCSLTVNILSSTNLSCSSDCDASANVSASGGSSPYFQLGGGQIGTTQTLYVFWP